MGVVGLGSWISLVSWGCRGGGLNNVQENHVPKVIALNNPDIPFTEDNEGPPDLINTEGSHEQNDQNEQITTQPTKGPSGNNTEVSLSINESLILNSHIPNQASTSPHPAPQDRWSRDQHVKLVNIIGNPGEGMLTRSMSAKLTAASASECLFADFLSKIEPKKPLSFESSEFPDYVCKLDKALYGLKQAPKAWITKEIYDSSSVKTPMVPPSNLGHDLAGTNKVWNLVPLHCGKIGIGSKWVFKNKKDKHGITTKNKARLVAQGYSQEEAMDYDETFAPVIEKLMTKKFEMSMIEELTYFIGLQIKQDDKGISICQEQYTRNLLKKNEIYDSSSVKTPMVPPSNLGPDLAGTGNKTLVDMEPINLPVADPSCIGAKYQVDQTQYTRLRQASIISSPSTKALDTDSSSDGILKKYDNTHPLTEQQLVKYLQKMSTVLFNRITEDNWEKHEEAAAHALKQEEELAAWDKSSTNMAWNLGFRLLCLKRPPSSVTPTLALTHIPANIKGENEPNTATEDPLSHTKGETDVNRQEKPKEPKHSTDANIEFIGSSTSQPSITQAQPITIINPIDAYLEKEEKIKKAKEEARLLAMKKPDYRGTNGRNFDVYNPFAFGNFSISDLNELREIIPKKKNVVVKDLINSLSQRYERIKKLYEELGIPSALPAPIPMSHLSTTWSSKSLSMESPTLMNSSPENARFSMKLKKLIAKNPDQENLKSKKVKLEAFGYEMD
uniref:Reverse transcriptase Ty1/copia-type domain-containing protein n=1 Tax=Tanacetum cinerariifolium TaxID=118510 RepID=A0A6L2NI55_TANCI|nr:hypothetical protein [Tanacetum cinerariifolium]